ncbi:MAG: hypothetical protein EOS61_15695 [Mesorhizobium sp.]|nr:MAG: hypothetical protein EOS61_15695 [Mesorhizobium sp.]
MGKEIGSLTAASTLTGAELLHVIQGGNSRQATVGALPAWRQAASWTYSADIANVDFTNLGSYNELMVLLRNVTASVSGIRLMYVSIDNGANFRNTSGDYKNINLNAAESDTTGFGFGTTNSTAARSGVARIPQSGLNGVPKILENLLVGLSVLFVQSTSPINALRFTNSTGGNFTGGSIVVLGR